MVVIGLVGGLILVVVLSILWLYGTVSTYLVATMHMTGLLEIIVALVATFILAYVMATLIILAVEIAAIVVVGIVGLIQNL